MGGDSPVAGRGPQGVGRSGVPLQQPREPLHVPRRDAQTAVGRDAAVQEANRGLTLRAEIEANHAANYAERARQSYLHKLLRSFPRWVRQEHGSGVEYELRDQQTYESVSQRFARIFPLLLYGFTGRFPGFVHVPLWGRYGRSPALLRGGASILRPWFIRQARPPACTCPCCRA